MENKKEKKIILLLAISVATIIVFGLFVGFEISSNVMNSYSSSLETEYFNEPLKQKMNLSINSAVKQENVVSYLSTQVKNLKLNWKVSKSNIKKGDKFNVVLTIKNRPSNFKLYWEDIGTKGIKINNIYGSAGKYTIECQASQAGEVIVQYIPTGEYIKINVKKNEVSTKKVKATFTISNKDIKNGDEFKLTLNLENISKDFKLYWSDISATGIKIKNIYGTRGKYTIECQANQEGNCIIKYIPTGEYVKIKIGKKSNPVQEVKASWSIPMNLIYKGDTFKVNLDIKNVQNDFKIYWEDFSISGITVSNIYGSQGKYVFECQASEVGKGRIKYIPTGEYVDITIYEKNTPIPSITAIWINNSGTINKGDIFNVDLLVQNCQSDFKLYWSDISTTKIKILNIYKNNNRYTFQCEATEAGKGTLKYIPTGDGISVNINENITPTIKAVWNCPVFVAKDTYFYAELTLQNTPSNYLVNLSDIGTNGISLIDMKFKNGKYIFTCKSNIEGNLVIKFVPTGDYSIISCK